MIQGCRFCLLGLKQHRNDINMALNPTKKKISEKLSMNIRVILQSDNCKHRCRNGTHVPHNAIIYQKKLKMEILPLVFMQVAVLKWNTCTTKSNHIPKDAEDGNPAIVVHASSSVEMEHMYHKMQNTPR